MTDFSPHPKQHFQPLWRFNYRLDATNGTLHQSPLTADRAETENAEKFRRPIAELPQGIVLSSPEELQQRLLLSNPLAGGKDFRLSRQSNQAVGHPTIAQEFTTPNKINVATVDASTRQTVQIAPSVPDHDASKALYYQKGHEGHWSAASTAVASERSDNDVAEEGAHFKTSTMSQSQDIRGYATDCSQDVTALFPQHNGGVPVPTQQYGSSANVGFAECMKTCDHEDSAAPSSSEKNDDRYVILPGGMFARPKDVYVESLPGGVGRQTGGCLVMSLNDLLTRYDALDKHYFRLKQENAQLRSILFEIYQRPQQGNVVYHAATPLPSTDPITETSTAGEQRFNGSSQGNEIETLDSRPLEKDSDTKKDVAPLHHTKSDEKQPVEGLGHDSNDVDGESQTSWAKIEKYGKNEKQQTEQPCCERTVSRVSQYNRRSSSRLKSHVISPVKAFIEGGYRNHKNAMSRDV